MRWLLGLRSSVVAALAVLVLPGLAVAQPPRTGAIHGSIVDARTGTPLRKVSVRLQATRLTTLTDDEGHFQLDEVAAGEHELYVSVVDFILVKRTVTVTAGQTLELTIPISEGSGAYTETVTVRPGATTRQEPAVASEQTLASTDLQQLRGLLTNDPFRAVQALPGVASTDDFGSQFTVRGADSRRMNFTFEGVRSPFLIHTVRDERDSGSVAMVNGDILEGISLMSGSYPQRFGDRTGGELDFRVREGSRERVQTRGLLSVTDASVVTEGPLGGGKRGSWLLSVRKSYLDVLLRRLQAEGTGFGFADTQAKFVYDVNSRHQVQLAVSAGRSAFDQEGRLDIDEVQKAGNQTVLGVLSWRYLPSARFTLTQRAAVLANTFHNTNRDGLELARGDAHEALYRSDWSFAAAAPVLLEGGGEIRRSAERKREIASGFEDGIFRTREEFSGSALAASAYVQARLTAGRGTLVPGARVDHTSLTGHTTASPWLQASWPLGRSVTFRGGTGIYRQEPDIQQVIGRLGFDGLRPERAYHVDAGLEGRIGPAGRWQATLYDREDRDLIDVQNLDLRLVDGTLAVPPIALPRHAQNMIDGHSRGVELLLQRRTPNGLSGWVSYALGFARYRDRTTGERFWGDFDQRHTINVYGTYRFNDRLSLSARFRAGSNYPTPGYWDARGGQYFVGETRNDLRVPVYSRLDFRANRTSRGSTNASRCSPRR